MHILKHFFLALLVTIATLFITGCSGGEADYTLEEVQSQRYVDDLIQGTITFITEDTMFVDQASKTVTTVKADTNENITYSIVGGADQKLFTIDAETGEVTFITTPAYDSTISNVYEVIVGVTTDAGELSILPILVTVVENINTIAPIIDFAVSNIDAVSSTAVITQIKARPANPTDNVTFTVKGSDAGSFSIDNDGNLRFSQPLPDYGTTPDKVYDIYVEVTDGHQNSVQTEPLSVTLVGNRDLIRPVVESSTFTVPENALGNMQLQVSTLGTGNVIKYILSGADAAAFSVDNTGVMMLKEAKDYELSNNSYNINVQVEDDKGNVSDLKPVVVSITDIDEQYDFQSISDITVLSGTKTVTQVTAISRVLTNVTRKYSLNNYADIFSIDTTGALQFKEIAVEGRSYDVEILVASYVSTTGELINGSQTVSASFNVKVVANPELIVPVIASTYLTTVSLEAPITAPITTIQASIDAGSSADTLTYSLRGTNASSFSISEGVLSLQSSVDYIAGGNNVYSVIVDVTDNYGNVTSTDTITVTVLQDPTTYVPVINNTTYVAVENSLSSITLEADARGNGNIASFSIVGGTDAGAFSVSGTQLSFNQAPDFETKANYNLVVKAINDSGYESIETTLAINIEDVDETLIFTSLDQFNYTEKTSFAVNITTSPIEGTTITYSVDSDMFSIDASSGVLTFKGVAPLYNTGVDAVNDYSVVVTAQSQYNGSLTPSPLITVTVLPADRSLTFSVSANDNSIFDQFGEVHLDQNTNTDITVTATSPITTDIAYSIEGDTNIFSINATTGVMTIAAPKYIFSDVAEINTYRAAVIATANDGFGTTDRLAGVMHVNFIDGTPVFTAVPTSVDENVKVIGTVAATLPVAVGSSLTYSIDGGADAALFKIDTTSGLLSFWNAQNFENARDVGGNNVYDVNVRVEDVNTQNNLNVATQAVSIQVLDVADAPTNISFADGTLSTTASDGYRTWFIYKWKYYITTSYRQVIATPSPSNGTLTYSIKTNPDSNIFSISTSGELRIDAPRESSDVTFTLEIEVNEANGETATQWLSVVIVND